MNLLGFFSRPPSAPAARERLQVLLAQYRLQEGGIHAVYPDPQPPAKVRAFIDFMRERLAKR